MVEVNEYFARNVKIKNVMGMRLIMLGDGLWLGVMKVLLDIFGV